MGSRYDEAVDVWSLGVILYVLLCGSMPFKESTLEDDIRNARYVLGYSKFSLRRQVICRLTTQGRWVKVSDEGKDLVVRITFSRLNVVSLSASLYVVD
jgi:serine/threonine protein kinase